MLYLTDADPRGSMGLAGKSVAMFGSLGDYLTAIDPTTGRIAWRHRFYGGGGGGILATAGGLLFTGDGAGNFAAFDDRDGTPLWRDRLGNISNAPQTFSVEGKQHVLAAAGDTLYTFVLK
jgi:alcohol dehydrogenase (cytochrome c)